MMTFLGQVALLVRIKMKKAKTLAKNVQWVSTAMPTPPHMSAITVQKATTVLRGHPVLSTNLVNQALTIPKSMGIPPSTVYIVTQVITVLVMEMTNLLIHAVLDFIVLVETKKLSQVPHAVHLVTIVHKARTT